MNTRQWLSQALRIADPVAAVALIPAALLMKLVRTAGVHRLPWCRQVLRTVGVFPIRDHYYEPQFIFPGTGNAQQSTARSLPGIDWNAEAQRELLAALGYADEIRQMPLFGELLTNPNFGPGDGEFLYQLVRHLRPRRIIEIGSGYSTRIAAEAVRRNQAEQDGYSCQHTCVEPYEMPWLESMGVTVIRQLVEQVDLALFDTLEAGDILFIDSSHMIRPSGDVLHEYLQILPRIPSGVIVHIHDIFSPFDYPRGWLVDEVRFWNEQYLLEAFLCQNPEWKILAGLNFLHKTYPAEFQAVCPFVTPSRNPGSFYIQKR